MKGLRTVLVALALAASLPATAFADCGAAADRDPTAPGASLPAARMATLCLLNARRHMYGERRLRVNAKLALAGLRHARDMVARQYFSHDEPSGPTFVQRIMQTNYVPPSASWALGENIAWADSFHATPREIVRYWMDSPDHRRNILTAKFREVGIAIVVGAPESSAGSAATYVTEFGFVRRW